MPTDELETLKSNVEAMKDAIHRIEKAIVGDLDMGHKGIAKRLYDVEKKTSEHSMRFYVWGGIASGVAIIATHFKNKLFP
jgi:hypothetical protein